MKRIAIYGGSFDPPHNGHLSIARSLSDVFKLDEFALMPAFHAPHKRASKPTSAFHRFAMLALATQHDANVVVSRWEVELPERPYTFETLTRLKSELADARIFFVMGADSWTDIATWFRWEEVLLMTDIVVVTRPGYELATAHVTDAVRARIVDLRGGGKFDVDSPTGIFFTDAVQVDVSATAIRAAVASGADDSWRGDVPAEGANYIEKYELYR